MVIGNVVWGPRVVHGQFAEGGWTFKGKNSAWVIEQRT